MKRLGRRIVAVIQANQLTSEGVITLSDDNVIELVRPGLFENPLTGVLRNGAQALLALAVEAEVDTFLARHAGPNTDDGRARVVRYGYLPEREVMSGIGPAYIRRPRVLF